MPVIIMKKWWTIGLPTRSSGEFALAVMHLKPGDAFYLHVKDPNFIDTNQQNQKISKNKKKSQKNVVKFESFRPAQPDPEVAFPA